MEQKYDNRNTCYLLPPFVLRSPESKFTVRKARSSFFMSCCFTALKIFVQFTGKHQQYSLTFCKFSGLHETFVNCNKLFFAKLS